MATLSNLRIIRQGQEGTRGLDSAGVLGLAGAGVDVFSTLDSLPSSNLEAGAKALVESVNRLYLSDGSGWYNLDLNTGFTPRWIDGGEPSATYEIADSATPLIITAKALDSDGTTPINQSFVSDSAQYMVEISNDSSVWTFTPKSADSIGIEVGAGNLSDSNGDFIYTFKWSDGINVLSKEVTISYSPGAFTGFWYGDRGIQVGSSVSPYNQLDYFSIPNRSGGSNFGNTANGNQGYHATCCQPAAVFLTSPGGEKVIPATLGSATSFSIGANSSKGGTSDGSRGMVFGGTPYGSSQIQYFAMDTAGSLTSAGSFDPNFWGSGSPPYNNRGHSYCAAVSNGTRALHTMGLTNITISGSQTSDQRIEYQTIQTPGNSQLFGQLTQKAGYINCVESRTIAVFDVAYDFSTGTYGSTMNQMNMDTIGNASYFGSMSYSGSGESGTSDGTYGVFSGGQVNQQGGRTNRMRYYNIATGGSAISTPTLSWTTNERGAGSANSS